MMIMMQFNIIFTVMSLMMSSVLMMMSLFTCGKCSSHGSVIESCSEVRI